MFRRRARGGNGPGDELVVERAIYAELQRQELSSLDYLKAVESRAAQLMASAAIVAALSAVVNITRYTVFAMGCFLVAAALGAAAQWPRNTVGGAPSRTLDGFREDRLLKGIRKANNGLAKSVAGIKEISRARTSLVRVGVVFQVVGLAVLVAGYAITLKCNG